MTGSDEFKRRAMQKVRGKPNVTHSVLSEDGSEVTYTCPECKTRQTHRWYGREKHFCTKCGKPTTIFGAQFAK